MGSRKVSSGEVIFQEGDSADVAYFVASGGVMLSQLVNGAPQKIRTLGNGDVFGELAFYAPDALRTYSAQATEDSELTTIAAEEMKAVLDAIPASMRALLNLAFDKMKPSRSKAIGQRPTMQGSLFKKLSITPVSDKMKAVLQAMEVPASRLPFRIGGYPEGGEPNRRDYVHLAVATASPPLRVSRQHCEIAIVNDTLVVTDLGSRFCTIVNGEAIGRGRGKYSAPLSKGENSITLGTPESNYTLNVICE